MLTSFNVLNKLQLTISVTKNPLNLKLDDLFEVGMRVNPKRSFLFVSKVIGKHLDVLPDIPKATGYLLADLFIQRQEGLSMGFSEHLKRFIETQQKTKEVKNALSSRYHLKDKTVFIGFAETATGLGHSVFSAFDGATFVHTTRENISSIPSLFDFKEEHSHATDHRCYLRDEKWIKEADHIVLVDDEMTTGKTSLNLIRSIHQVYPKSRYTILSILDWRNEQQVDMYKEVGLELGTKIETVSLVSGSISIEKEELLQAETNNQEITVSSNYRQIITHMKPKVEVFISSSNKNFIPYLEYTGRFGLSSDEHDKVEMSAREIGKYLTAYRKGKKTLVIGTGEFMFIPSRIASYMGCGVFHKSSTRSPIFPSQSKKYPIHDRTQFVDEENSPYFLYNLKKEKYDEVFVILERFTSKQVMEMMTAGFEESGIKNVMFVTL